MKKIILLVLLVRLFPRIRPVIGWIHIDDISTIDAEFVLDKWTVTNDDGKFLNS